MQTVQFLNAQQISTNSCNKHRAKGGNQGISEFQSIFVAQDIEVKQELGNLQANYFELLMDLLLSFLFVYNYNLSSLKIPLLSPLDYKWHSNMQAYLTISADNFNFVIFLFCFVSEIKTSKLVFC